MYLFVEGLTQGVLVYFQEIGVKGSSVFCGPAPLQERVEQIVVTFSVFKCEVH